MFKITPNNGYLAELDVNTCYGTLSGSTYTISNVNKNMSCSITFKAPNPYNQGTLAYQILNDKTTRKGKRFSFSTTLTADNTKTLYTSTENGTTVYHFAGNATDNWVKFGKNSSGKDLYWRIIRTNADGGIRLLYHSTSTIAEDAYIGNTEFNSTDNDSMYVGYMYGTSGSLESNRTNTNNSTIKAYIDTWYANNLTNYTKYLSTTAIYCNDREVGSGTYSAKGSDAFFYKALTRLEYNIKPTYDCTNTSDAFSVSNTSAKLTYPIGLMTADEIALAGGKFRTEALAYYYRNSSSTSTSSTGSTSWWTMSPYNWYEPYSYVFFVNDSNSTGSLESVFTLGTFAVRPVTSLKSCVKWASGDGSADKPYTIVEDGGC